MKKKTAALTVGFLSLGVLVLASNMTADGREGAKGKTIPYTLEITLPENAADGSMICFQQASQESGESKDSEDKAHENASGNLVIGYNQDTGRPSVFFTGQEEIILNEKNELVWKDCRQPVILTDKIQVVSTPDYDYRFLMKDAEGREQILSFFLCKNAKDAGSGSDGFGRRHSHRERSLRDKDEGNRTFAGRDQESHRKWL